MDNDASHYSNFDVMDQKEHWDPHTREIVEKRLKNSPYQVLNQEEAEILYKICTILLDDTRDFVVYYVVRHFDNKLSSDIGEAQRKKGVPNESILIREGLRALNLFCITMYDSPYIGLEDRVQHNILDEIIRGNVFLNTTTVRIPAQDFFKKLLTEAVAAYYSHPTVWSEIGYAGPAYPRGYVRSEWGLTDPWEATRDAKS